MAEYTADLVDTLADRTHYPGTMPVTGTRITRQDPNKISITPIDADRTANPQSLAAGRWSFLRRLSIRLR